MIAQEVNDWKLAAELKKQSLISSIPEKWRIADIKTQMKNAGYVNPHLFLDSILPKDEVIITNKHLHELRVLIKKGTLSAYSVTEAFCHRSALAHQLLNCCIEIFYVEALEKAQKLDDYFAVTGDVKGPLHGIPISLKDQVDLPGKDSSIGYVGLLGQPAGQIALMAKVLEDMGAVFYVKTAVPMAMMLPETYSNLHGYTFNGVNINLSPGGSSGGEGSLIGAGGSCMGFGTDIGGSIRIPSAFQGLYSLKPSVGRFSYSGVTNSYSGQEVVPSVIGPMSTSLKDIQIITELIVASETWNNDPKVMPIPWRDMSHLKDTPLTIGIWRFDGAVMPHPPIQRALRQVEAHLKEKGHKIVELTFPLQSQILSTISRVFGADAAYDVESICAISGEPIVPTVKEMIQCDDINEPITVNEWWNLADEVYGLKKQFYEYWKDNSLDAILAPVWPSTASLPYGQPTINYTAPFNLCDCCSVVVPITNVDRLIDEIDTSYVPINPADNHMYQSYDPDLFDKMPVCLQVVTKKLEEEKALVVASIIDEIHN
ncbi:Acetamidase [Scheffersomyces stipitis CBS 6054]|uniref:amidase n=1 Tax=Scheffersomyces stipitis (strain ATCC 58785 / CBS 6054 / NBRC 10063 / NRRL Y-11545) TaxID=322104 RepID=A3LWM3_PICST|nr:Acetamidase [Scheffersomyces stipitis CBS 6054]ABN67307.2 Acetamidase [Scheffersomyces stipitis CBS 6054]